MGSTLENLQAAYNGESNAKAKYQAFAKKADAEGYSQVASLFRAAAYAEGIHAAQHARVIKSLDGAPMADLKAIDIKSTAENLQAAIAGEIHERDVMYPEFIAQAKKDGNENAVRSFKGALDAEAEHARMYQEALQDIANRNGGKRDYWVCEVCGFTLDKAPAPGDRCQICNAPAEKFKIVN